MDAEDGQRDSRGSTDEDDAIHDVGQDDRELDRALVNDFLLSDGAVNDEMMSGGDDVLAVDKDGALPESKSASESGHQCHSQTRHNGAEKRDATV